MTSRKDFIESLKNMGTGVIKEDVKNITSSFIESIEEVHNDNRNRFFSKEHMEYIHNVMACIMLEYDSYNKGYSIFIPYRFKSEFSEMEKIIDYANRTFLEKDKENNIEYDAETEKYNIKFKPITDIVASKIVLSNSSPIFYSYDSSINELIKEREENYKFLKKMQRFRSKLIKNEFNGKETYQYTVKKKDYYNNCMLLVNKIKLMLAPEATELREKYTKIFKELSSMWNIIYATQKDNQTISSKDFNPNSSFNFCYLLEDFTQRIEDKLDLEILTKQIQSLFEKSELLKQLGVEILSKDLQENSTENYSKKRTSGGYVANFLILKTLVGNIECQIQSQHEYEAGNYGYSAHNNLSNKNIPQVRLPNFENAEQVTKFKDNIICLSPEYFICQMDTIEKQRAQIKSSDTYQNYKNVLDKIEEGPIYEELLEYLDVLYENRDKFSTKQTADMGIIYHDLNKYIESARFRKIRENAHQKEETKTTSNEEIR